MAGIDLPTGGALAVAFTGMSSALGWALSTINSMRRDHLDLQAKMIEQVIPALSTSVAVAREMAAATTETARAATELTTELRISREVAQRSGRS